MRHLAIDIGATSGRHILGSLEDGKLVTREVHRFENGFAEKNGRKVWDTNRLFGEIVAGMKKCRESGLPPDSVGIDTWGVDYLLVDENLQPVGDAVAYRDERTAGIQQKVFSVVPAAEIYARTGIQFLDFNTIFQLMADKFEGGRLEGADRLLMMPDYLCSLLSGKAVSEYTIASTTGLLSARTGGWDYELIDKLSLPKKIFRPLVPPGTVVGNLKGEVRDAVGFDCAVIAVAQHDTASAVAAVPFAQANAAYISSGTWSLIGVERGRPDTSQTSMRLQFTNEGGYGGKIRYLKNIMGMWMIEEVRRELPEKIPYDTLCAMADESSVDSLVDCEDFRFLAPRSMSEAIRAVCRESGQQVPETPGDLARVIYRSLAEDYSKCVRGLEESTGAPCPVIHIVGGGARAAYLNDLTAKRTGRRGLAGPYEATAAGNLLAQMIGSGAVKDLDEAREIMRISSEIKEFVP